MARTGRESDRRRSSRLVGAAETSKERAEWHRLQRKNLSILGLLKRKDGLSATERAVGEYAGAALAKRKRNRAVSPEYQIMRGDSQGGREPHLGEREGDQSGSMRRKGRASKKNLPKRSRRKHERVSGRKSSPGRSAESWFYSKSGQT